MTKPTETTWEIEPHTKVKHDILRRYLGAWFGILGQRIPRIMYLDGFCGPGRYKGGEDGSPIIALKEALKQQAILQSSEILFYFIDADPNRTAHLEAEIAQLSPPLNYKVLVQTGEFHILLQDLLDRAGQDHKNLVPTFAFIDPFGFKGVPFELVKRLLANPHTEVFINVMIEFINRFVEHPDPQTQQHIIDLFGSSQILEIIRAGGDRLAALRQFYFNQLGNHAQFVRYFEMRNERNQPFYYLYFATKHPLGHVRMKEAFWKVDPSTGFTFSDRSNPRQPVLFNLDPSKELSKILKAQYRQRTVGVDEIRRFVEDRTAYTESQMKSSLLSLEGQQEIFVLPVRRDGKNRRKGSFPDEVAVRFS